MAANVEFECTDNVAIVRLADPATLNALTPELVEALHDAAHRATREARAMLLCGAGRGFCSGWTSAAPARQRAKAASMADWRWSSS